MVIPLTPKQGAVEKSEKNAKTPADWQSWAAGCCKQPAAAAGWRWPDLT
eukprot:CAMPEP_0171115282 /NCGR_PEP_ID=MMETSP0766_2-20121228/87420_1 /TAXON_ID=439317 /ORGANISM="Gambierdiscus australes, Strain CAWD 149" /LENGTH=48 /DNA_ID= /DNA_START= /DNA_END= /DNA_ORIENTATION=